MIAFVTGEVANKELDHVIVNRGGIGFRIYTSLHSLETITEGEEAVFYTHLVVREDDMSLYGFTQKEEMELFLLLITVKGIGPKVAIGVLSGLKPSQLVEALVNQDVTMLTKAPGIGKKTAERMILELKDKVDVMGNLAPAVEQTVGISDEEVIEALAGLGYHRSEVMAVLPSIDASLAVEDKIKQGLKLLLK